MIQKIVLTILLCSLSLSAQEIENSIWVPPDKDSMLVIMDHAYNLEFEQFNEKLDRYRKKYPTRPEGIFAPIVSWWIKVSSDIYNPKYDTIFIEAIDSIITELEEINEDDPLYPVAEFYVFSAKGFKGIMHVTRGNWFSAALDGRAAIQGVEQALRGEVPNPDAKLGTGLYLYYADIIPKKYPILKPLFYFYPEGDKEQGLKELLNTTRDGIFAKVVASYMYSVILFTREKDYFKAYRIVSRLSDSYPQNPTFLLLRAGLATRINSFNKALKLLHTFEERIKSKTPYYPETKLRALNYRFGDVYFKKSDYKTALYYFKKSIEPLSEDLEELYYRFKVYSLLGAGRCSIQLNELSEAENYFKQVLDLNEVRDSHEWAEEGLKKVDHLKGALISN